MNTNCNLNIFFANFQMAREMPTRNRLNITNYPIF